MTASGHNSQGLRWPGEPGGEHHGRCGDEQRKAERFADETAGRACWAPGWQIRDETPSRARWSAVDTRRYAGRPPQC